MPPFFPGQFDAFVDRGRPAPAGARPVPRRLHRHDAARSSRAQAPGSGAPRTSRSSAATTSAKPSAEQAIVMGDDALGVDHRRVPGRVAVGHQDHAIAQRHRAAAGRIHAHLGLHAGDHQPVDAGIGQGVDAGRCRGRSCCAASRRRSRRAAAPPADGGASPPIPWRAHRPGRHRAAHGRPAALRRGHGPAGRRCAARFLRRDGGGGDTANMPCWTSTIINALVIGATVGRTSRAESGFTMPR